LCFSPEADLVTGIVVSGVGIDALRRVPCRRYLPLAALPLLLGLHQVIEAFAWWGVRGDLPRQVGETAVWVYLAIALVVVPAFVPAAFRSAEADAGRRARLFPFVLLGVAVAAALLPGLFNSGVGGEAACRYIAYDTGVNYSGYVFPFYVAATCLPMLLASSRRLVFFGMANLVVVALLGWLLASGVISLWCAWAAVSSVILNLEVRSAARRSERVRSSAPV
jgi:hypothetical protein